jgi:hypothetical protein
MIQQEQMQQTRAEAKTLGAGFYFTGKPCSKGHIAKRRTTSGTCYECQLVSRRKNMAKLRKEKPEVLKARQRVEYLKHAEGYKTRQKINYYSDIEQSRAKAREYAEAHRPEARQRAVEWREQNPERKKEADAKFNALNPALVLSYKAEYRAAKLRACPAWLTEEHRKEIQRIYQQAREQSEREGVLYEVDHEIPLRGKTVRGLHVPWNLRVVTKTFNNRRPRIWGVA